MIPTHRAVPAGGGGAGPVRAGMTCIARLRAESGIFYGGSTRAQLWQHLTTGETPGGVRGRCATRVVVLVERYA